MSRVLYLPVEVSKRELNSRIAVGIAALGGNFDSVVIGKMCELYQRMDKPGVVLLKSATIIQDDHIKKLKEEGHLVYSLDEEGLLPPINDPAINKRFSQDNFDKIDGVFANGPLEVTTFPSWIQNSEKLRITGNPRFDFYPPEKRSFYDDNIRQIKKLTNNTKVILLVSRFGDVNPPDYFDMDAFLKDSGFVDSAETERFFKGFLSHTKKIFDEFVKLPSVLAEAFPDHLIVVRPHPGENPTTWQNTQTHERVIINNDFDIASWLSCAEVMIHNGCTTSLESAAMEVPVVSFTPYESKEFDLKHANELGIKAHSQSEVKEAVETIFNNEYDFQKHISTLQDIVLFSSERSACRTISDFLSNKDIGKTNNSFGFSGFKRLAGFYSRYLLKYFLYRFDLRADHSRYKYSLINRTEFDAKVRRVSEALSFPECNVKRKGLDIYELQRN